jgi:hypothetical protein
LDATVSTWPEMGDLNTHNPLSCLLTDASGNLYVGGELLYSTQIYGYTYSVSYLAKWNGVQWSEVGTGANALKANSGINTICRDDTGNVYAAGGFTDTTFFSSYWIHPDGQVYIAKWNGSSWSRVGNKGCFPGNGGHVFSLVYNSKNGYLYASMALSYNPTFTYDVYYWNGLSWNILDNSSSKLNRSIGVLYVDNNGNLYAGGTFTNSNGKYYVAQWNGTNWIELGTGTNGLNANGYVQTICSDASGNLYAAGNFTNASGRYYVAKWDGTTWAELSGVNSMSADGAINSICFDNADNLYAGGLMSYWIGPDRTYYIAKWDGAAWSVVGKNTLFAKGIFACLIPRPTGGIYAAGSFSDTNNKTYVTYYP